MTQLVPVPGKTTDHAAATIEEMERFILAYRAYLQEQWSGDADQFDILDLFGIKMSENQHSAFLAWMLDREESHGQGDLFLRTLLDCCQPKPDLPIPPEYRVQTEFWGGRSSIDVLVYQPHDLLVYIENKIGAAEGKDQLHREFQDMRRLGWAFDVPAERQAAIFLTPTGRLPAAGHKHPGEWHSAAYTAFGHAVETLLPQLNATRLIVALETWLDVVREFTPDWRHPMSGLSETSILIAKNLPTVANILDGFEGVQAELDDMLSSVGTGLKNLDWWQQGWQVADDRLGLYISHENWLQEDDYFAVWIGVHDFDIGHVFGLATPPYLCVAIRQGYDDLRRKLLDRWQCQDDPNVRCDPNNEYPIVQDLPKCLVDEQTIRKYPEVVRQQLITFSTRYASRLIEADDLIRQHMATKRGQARQSRPR